MVKESNDPSPQQMDLKGPNLCLKSCLELYTKRPFSLQDLLNSRRECVEGLMAGSVFGVKIGILREHMPNIFRQALTIFSDCDSERMVISFMNDWFLSLLVELRSCLQNGHFERQELCHLWHSSRLAGSALDSYCFNFAEAFEDVFEQKMLNILCCQFDERIGEIEDPLSCTFDGPISSGQLYDLKTTILLNCAVDLINQVRLCPESKNLCKLIANELTANEKIPEKLKEWTIKELTAV